ncbi:16809_t:CDS:2 [Rhizophagus irregularis]|nr:16809_t:CDS:2 [Rhizophagus irregularis]
MAPATRGEVYVMVNGQQAGFGGSWSRKGFNVYVSDITSEFNLTFSVEDSSEQDKYRGPFKNNKDYEWKFSGSLDIWHIEQLAYNSTNTVLLFGKNVKNSNLC